MWKIRTRLPDTLSLSWRVARVWLASAVFAIAVIAIFTFDILPVGKETLEASDVAAHDVRSPRHATFASDILTEAARERAEANVAPIFTPPDGRVARQQIAFARKVAEYIRSIRADSSATLAEKQAKLTAITGISLSPTVASDIVQLRDDDWDKIEAEMLATLDWAMHSEIREDNLSQARARVPALVSTALTEEQATIAGARVDRVHSFAMMLQGVSHPRIQYPDTGKAIIGSDSDGAQDSDQEKRKG